MENEPRNTTTLTLRVYCEDCAIEAANAWVKEVRNNSGDTWEIAGEPEMLAYDSYRVTLTKTQ